VIRSQTCTFGHVDRFASRFKMRVVTHTDKPGQLLPHSAPDLAHLGRSRADLERALALLSEALELLDANRVRVAAAYVDMAHHMVCSDLASVEIAQEIIASDLDQL
jgi:hypothetical protein